MSLTVDQPAGSAPMIQKNKRRDEEEGRNPDGDGEGEKSRVWEDLPAELFELILQRLSTMDYLQCRSVCSSWRIMVTSAIASRCCPPAPQSPFLLLFPPLNTDGDYHLLSLSEDRLSTMKGKKTSGVTCLGSIEGWLIMKYFGFSNEDLLYHFTYFLNPVSGAKIMLPTTVTSLFPKANPESMFAFSCKVVASSVPDLPDCLVATLLNCGITKMQQLGFFRVTDKSWTMIDESKWPGWLTVIAFYDDKLYAVTFSSNVMVFDLRDPNAVITTKLIMLDPKPVPRVGDRLIENQLVQFTDTERVKLVKDTTRDELLLVFNPIDCVLRFELNHPIGYVFPPKTKGFRVFMLDKSGSRWVEVDNLGDRSLFLDTRSSTVISTADVKFPRESIKGNCIYFAFHSMCSENPSLARDIGVFSLTDKSIKHISLSSSFQIQAPALWFTPSPW